MARRKAPRPGYTDLHDATFGLDPDRAGAERAAA